MAFSDYDKKIIKMNCNVYINISIYNGMNIMFLGSKVRSLITTHLGIIPEFCTIAMMV